LRLPSGSVAGHSPASKDYCAAAGFRGRGGRWVLPADPEVTSYKLELVASRLGVELDDAHDAAADVTATLDILGVYTSRLRQTEGTATAMQKKEKTRKYFKI